MERPVRHSMGAALGRQNTEPGSPHSRDLRRSNGEDLSAICARVSVYRTAFAVHFSKGSAQVRTLSNPKWSAIFDVSITSNGTTKSESIKLANQ